MLLHVSVENVDRHPLVYNQPGDHPNGALPLLAFCACAGNAKETAELFEPNVWNLAYCLWVTLVFPAVKALSMGQQLSYGLH